MDAGESSERLSHIHTLWTTVREAHAGTPETVSRAQHQLLERYSQAVYRYLLGAVRDAEAADEPFQEFALRFVRGDFHRADPRRGRFRDFLKTALAHLVSDYRRGQRRWPAQPASADALEAVSGEPPPGDTDRDFLTIWRGELIARTWETLAQHDRRTGQPLSLVLGFHTQHPGLRSPEAAKQLSEQLGKPVSPDWVRKWLARARAKFNDLFLDEVACSLEKPAVADLEQELAELGLLNVCRAALRRRRENIWS